MTPYFIVNPIAGGGGALDKFRAAKAYLDSRRAEYRYILTEHEHQSAQLAEQAYADGERLIVAVGGDGTVSEVASALYDKPDVTMGVFPFGTGNDLARALEIPKEPEAAAELLLNSKGKPMDMGLAGDTPFINVGGMGFDVDVLNNTDRYKKRFHGMMPYVFGIMHALFHLKRPQASVTFNGKTVTQKVTICAVAIGKYFGGGMKVAPEALPDDGLFDVCLVEGINMLQLLWLLPRFIKGKHLSNRHVKYFRTDKITIACERQPLQLDGELGAYAPVCFKVLPGALRMVMP